MPDRAVSVVHVHSGNLFGGVERILEALGSFPAPDGEMTSSFALCFKGRLHDALHAAGARVEDLGAVQIRRLDQVWRARRALRRTLSAGRFDLAIVHSSWSQAIFGPTILAAGLPLVRWFHAPDPGPWWIERWADRARPALALCNSQYTLSGAEARLGDIPASIAYPPTAWPVVATSPSRAQLRASLETPADAVVVVMTSRIEPLKGHRLLLEALQRLPRTNWKVWVVGGAQRPEEVAYLEELRRMVAAADLDSRVTFLGERTDVPNVLAAADVFCQPNTGPEAFGLSFVEAMALGRPVVTTRLGAAPEVVGPECGILVEPGSSDQLAGALASLIGDEALRQQLGASGSVRAARFCDLPSSFRALADTLRTVMPLSIVPS